MIKRLSYRKKLAGVVLAGAAVAVGLAIGIDRAAAFRGGFGGFRGGFGGFHGGFGDFPRLDGTASPSVQVGGSEVS